MKSELGQARGLTMREYTRLRNKYEKFIALSANFLGVPLKKDIRDRILIHPCSFYAPTFNLPAYKVAHVLEKIELSPYSPVKILFVDVRYSPQKVLLPQLKTFLEREQRNYFALHPEEKNAFIKVMRDGRSDAYPFDDWERYLKVYMLQKGGMTSTQIQEQLYQENYRMLTPSTRQVFKDAQHARKLSENALRGDFPGEY
ncbi:hypothetical protein MUP35_00760 [Patescibacteria group bacterium]|nr:hypothetical protein [Patescibacteria group bacterium]